MRCPGDTVQIQRYKRKNIKGFQQKGKKTAFNKSLGLKGFRKKIVTNVLAWQKRSMQVYVKSPRP